MTTTKLSRIISLFRPHKELMAEYGEYLKQTHSNPKMFLQFDSTAQIGLTLKFLVDKHNINIHVDKFFVVVQFYDYTTEQAKKYTTQYNKAYIYSNLDAEARERELIKAYIMGIEQAIKFITTPF